MLKRNALFVAVALALAVLFAAPAAAQSTKFTYATGRMFEGANITQGQITFTPTGGVHLRNAVAGWYITDAFGVAARFFPATSSSEANRALAGPMRVEINCNLDPSWQGECWGTVEMTVGDGRWDGAWSGKFDLARYIARITLTASGSGSFAGKELKFEAMGPAIDADFYFLAEVFTK